jgi:ligand-binding sensor domain-containing protein/signal transduction histidine kinase
MIAQKHLRHTPASRKAAPSRRYAGSTSMCFLRHSYELLLPVLLCIPLALNAQIPGISGINVSIKRITTDQEFSRANVYAITQDKEGFIWVGSRDGLYRFDGQKSEVFRATDSSTSLSNNWILSLCVDKEGYLWVGTLQGLNRFDPATRSFRRYCHDPADASSLSDNEVASLCEDRAGVLWVGTSRGLNRFERSSEKWKRYVPSPNDTVRPGDNYISALLEDHEGSLWVGTGNFSRAGGGLLKLDRTLGSFSRVSHSAPGRRSAGVYTNANYEWITSIFEDSSGDLWVSVDGDDVNRLDRKSGRFTHLLLPSESQKVPGPLAVKTILEDQRGAIWIATWGGGLFRYDRRTGDFLYFSNDAFNPASLSNRMINTLFLDRSGLLWVGTDNGGVNTVATKPFLHRRTFGNFCNIDSRVDELFADRDGGVWISAVGFGLRRFDPATGQTASFKAFDETNVVFEESAAAIWISQGREVARYNRTTDYANRVLVVSYQPEFIDWIVRMLLDREGSLWVGATTSVYKYDLTSQENSHFAYNAQDSSSITDGGITSIQEDRSGNIWIGTTKGLNRYNKGSPPTFTRFVHDVNDSSSLSSNWVGCLFEDRQGTLWVCTNDGLNRFNSDDGTFSRFYPRKHPPGYRYNKILDDEKGKFWFAADGGISSFDPGTEEFHHYDESDGIASDDVRGWPCTRLRDGEFVFGTSSGVVVFHPDSVKTASYLPPIVITGLRKSNQPVDLSASPGALHRLSLEYEDNVFSIEYAALSYDMPGNNEFAYRLEGFDKNWVYCGTRREATYTNLDPGTYTFHVKGSNHDGLWNEAGTSLVVVIQPAYWQTWWFRGLLLVALIGVVANVVGYVERTKANRKIERLERERAVERERARISQDMHDEVGSSLSEISILSELIKKDLPSPGAAAIRAQEISERSGEVIGNIGEIIWALNPKNDPVETLIAYLRRYAVHYVELAGVRCTFLEPAELPPYRVASAVRRNIFLIVKEALHNIVKHAAASEVTMEVKTQEKSLKIHIHDNGKGFVPETRADAGNGLASMKKRAAEMGATIEIESQPGCGTTVRLNVEV